MSKYCPICLAEYRDTVKVCPKDQSDLTTKKPASYERLVDCYAAVDKTEVEHLISLLNDEGFVAVETVTGMSQLPVAGQKQFIIAVLREDLKGAKGFIEQARRDGVISDKGSFC